MVSAGAFGVVVFSGALALLPVLSSAAGIGDLSEAEAKRLDEVRKSMEPKPYEPSNALGCKRWKGRAFIARPGMGSPCHGGCVLDEVDQGRYEVTGASCRARGHSYTAQVAVAPVATPEALVERCIAYMRRDGVMATHCSDNAGPMRPAVTSSPVKARTAKMETKK